MKFKVLVSDIPEEMKDRVERALLILSEAIGCDAQDAGVSTVGTCGPMSSFPPPTAMPLGPIEQMAQGQEPRTCDKWTSPFLRELSAVQSEVSILRAKLKAAEVECALANMRTANLELLADNNRLYEERLKLEVDLKEAIARIAKLSAKPPVPTKRKR